MQKKKKFLDLKEITSEENKKNQLIIYQKVEEKTNQRKIWNAGVEASFEIVIRWSRKIKFEQRLDGCDNELDWTF